MTRHLTLAFLLSVPTWRVAAQEPPIPLTSDTAQYCAQLAQTITDRHSTIPDVVRLLADGREMCDQGAVRSGLRRLRRALVILDRKTRGTAAAPSPDKPLEPPPY
jgi:hypothetical protein